MKRLVALGLILAMALALWACSEDPAPTQAATAAPQTVPTVATTQPTAADPVGTYRITGLRVGGSDDYRDETYGALSIYADGTGDIYFDDYYHDFTWKMDGDQFSATTTDELNIPLQGTLCDGVLELKYEENVYLRFQLVTQQELAQQALDYLRMSMTDSAEMMAVAYLGWFEGEQDFSAWLEETCPDMLVEYPFIADIPKERIIGENGEVYCLVPKDALFRLEISLLTEDGQQEQQVLYESTGEPVLLMCNYGAFYPDMQVVVTEDTRDEVIFYPYLDSNGRMVVPTDGEHDDLVYDFTNYFEVCGDYYRAMLATGWSLPDEALLTSTCWYYYEDTEQERSWTLNLSGDGTVQLTLAVDGAEQTHYAGTWGLNWSDNDGLTWLYLNMAAEDDQTFEGECVVLRSGYDDGILLGVKETQGSMPVPSEDQATFWWSAEG